MLQGLKVSGSSDGVAEVFSPWASIKRHNFDWPKLAVST
jgi:predicted amidohydrolase YtcJ